MGDKKTLRLRVQIPSPDYRNGEGTGHVGAKITDLDTGKDLPCKSMDLHIDSEMYQPVMTLEVLDATLDMTGTFRFERIGD